MAVVKEPDTKSGSFFDLIVQQLLIGAKNKTTVYAVICSAGVWAMCQQEVGPLKRSPITNNTGRGRRAYQGFNNKKELRNDWIQRM